MSSSFPNLRTPLVDKNGFIAEEWRKLFQSLWDKVTALVMATIQLNLFGPTQLTGVAASLYTSGSNYSTRVDKFTATNTDAGAAHTVTVYAVPPGKSADNTNIIVPAQSIAAGTATDLSAMEGQVLGPNFQLWALASTGGVINVMGGGAKITQ